MEKRNVIKILLSVLIIICFVCVCFKSIDNQKGTTLKEAYNIAYKEVYKKNPQVLLVSIGSTDSKLSKEDNYAGNNGKRNSWNLIFAVPNSSENWIVTIRDKKIKDIEKTTGILYARDDLIDTKDLTIDSNKALKIAKKKYVLRHGEVWAIGYHFSLSKEGGDAILQVICRDYENNFAKISIDTKTKKITDAIHKISIGGGIYDGNTDKALIDKYDIDGITNNANSTLLAWGRKMINIVQYDPIVLYKGYDDKEWSELTCQENIKNIIPLAESDFLIICEQSIYRYNSNNISNILVTEEPIFNSFFYKDKLYIITKSKLSISPDIGKSWKTIPLPEVNDISKIPIDIDEENNTLYININNKVYSLKNVNWIEIINNDDIINDFKYSNHSIIYTTDNSINIYDLKTNENKKIDKNIIIKKLIKYGQAYIYAISDEGKLFEIKKESDNNDWIILSLKTNVNGFVTDILHIDKKTWYYSTVSEPKWVKFNN